MNEEEELKKGCGKKQGRGLNFYRCGDLLMNVLCPYCKGKLEGFQKGKLEERERIKRIIIKLREGFGAGKIWSFDEFEEQLQKEIGGMK